MATPAQHGPIRKKFNAVSATGLGIAKNGKLQFPLVFQMLNAAEKAGAGLGDVNSYLQPRPKVGDFCASAIPSGLLTAGTVGRIVAEDKHYPIHDGSYTIELLNGETVNAWRYGVGFLTEAQAKEVRDYYVEKEKRPERIKRDFWKP